MAKFQSPLLGYNNNVRHRGRLFHIQTEDSGVNHPHIITHLFMDGGRILKSVKKSYAEHVGTDNMSETVRVLMKEQHKAMFIALRDGQFDALVDGGKKPSGAMPAVVPANAKPTEAKPAEAKAADAKPAQAKPADAKPAQAKPADAKPAEAQPVAPTVQKVEIPNVPAVDATAGVKVTEKAAARQNVAVVESEASPVTRPEAPKQLHTEDHAPATIDEGFRAAPAPVQPLNVEPPLPPELEALLRDELPPPPSRGVRAAADAEPKTTREPDRGGPERHQSAHELTLDFDALERESAGPSPLFNQAELPPPPKNLFAKEPGTGKYRAFDGEAHRESRVPPTRPQAVSGRTPPTAPVEQGSASPRAPAAKPAASEGRYAPARPAAIFGAPAKQSAPSIFSDDLLSDKSLDEVILSYLAEDLDPPRRK
jgi:hypothetical protein